MADLSLESSFDITADLIEATPIEKCSLNPRRGRNSRRLLTGFIIYASEVRKQVVEQYPDQNFGFISKLVGDKWRALTTELRFKYHQRALIHNKRIKELAAREGVSLGDIDLANGSVIKAPKITKKKLAKLAKQEQKRLNDSSESTTPNHDKSSVSPETPIGKRLNGASNNINSNQQQAGTATSSTTTATTTASSTVTKNYSNYSAKQADNHYVQANNHFRSHSKKVNTVDTSTQTPSIRFIEPPPKKRLTYSDAFLKRLEELQRQCEQRKLQQ